MRTLFSSLVTTLACLALFNTGLAQGLKQDLFSGLSPFAQAQPKTEVTSALVARDQPGTVILQIKLVMPNGVNTYSMDPKLPKPTRVLLALPDGWSALDTAFTADPPPKKSFDEVLGQDPRVFPHALAQEQQPDSRHRIDVRGDARGELLVLQRRIRRSRQRAQAGRH